MVYLGMFLLVMTVVAFIWNMKVSYDTRGGNIGQVPVLGTPVIQLPLTTVMGISLIDNYGSWFHFNL